MQMNDLLGQLLEREEFVPYGSLFHLQIHELAGADTLSVSVVLQYEVDRYLAELTGVSYSLLESRANDFERFEIVYEKVAEAMRQLIGRAHAGNYIAGSEAFQQLAETVRQADKAFE
jgi:hypothetical protein